MEAEPLHVPVMVREVVEALRPEDGGWFVDCTLGMGGHGRAILEAGAGACLLGLDRDADALRLASERLSERAGRFLALHANFKDMDRWAPLLPEAPAGILVDLGMSGYQLKSGRGFSFHDASALDMRMDPSEGQSARDLLNTIPEKDLARILRMYGEEPFAGRIARAVCRERLSAPLQDAATLARIVERAVPAAAKGRIHPATRTFQALRIAVNRELEGLGEFLERAVGLLTRGGRLAVLAYHSLEDRTVKDTLRRLSRGCVCPPRLPACACGRSAVIDLPHRKALRPSPQEVLANPASRSARLRVAVKR